MCVCVFVCLSAAAVIVVESACVLSPNAAAFVTSAAAAAAAAVIISSCIVLMCPPPSKSQQVYGAQLPEKLCQMLTSGIPVTINSDDPAYFGAYVNGNYEFIAGLAGLGADDIAALAQNSFNASFLPEEQKAAAFRQVQHVLAAWKAEQPAAQQQEQQQL